MMSTKLIKSEPQLKQDIKTESGHLGHPKEPPQPLGSYTGMYQRSIMPPSVHSREEELRL